ncbi:hypothetical protein QTN25_002432 [Entamoeba marina]
MYACNSIYYYYLDSDSNTCKTCITSDNHCTQCSNASICIDCVTGYVLFDNGECETCPDNCVLFDASDTSKCQTCASDYFITKDYKCSACSTKCQESVLGSTKYTCNDAECTYKCYAYSVVSGYNGNCYVCFLYPDYSDEHEDDSKLTEVYEPEDGECENILIDEESSYVYVNGAFSVVIIATLSFIVIIL